MDEELYHHGILGQKWGVRRFQNEDGSITPAGARRYYDNVDVNNKKKAYKEARDVFNKADLKSYDKAKLKMQFAKEDLDNEKAKIGLNKEVEKGKTKSKHRLKLEQMYKDKGMNDEEAEIAAYKRAKTEKAIAITAGLTLAAATAIIAKKQYDYRVDKIIPEGTLMQNVSVNANKGVEDAFYASTNKGDMAKYRGMYGKQLKSKVFRGERPDVYAAQIAANKDIKIASPKNAKNVLNDMVNNDDKFKSDLRTRLKVFDDMNMPGKQGEVFKKALKSLDDGKVDDNVYNAFNVTFTEHNHQTRPMVEKFYSELKNKGYGAIGDINDKKFSGYDAKSATIFFNGKSDLVKKGVKEVTNAEIEKDFKNSVTRLAAKNFGKQVATYGGIGVAAGGASTAASKIANNRTNDQIVKKYKADHPNTELSYNEIVRLQRKR